MSDPNDRSGDVYISDHDSDHGHTDFGHDSGEDHTVNYGDGFHVSFDTGKDPGGVHLTDHGSKSIYD